MATRQLSHHTRIGKKLAVLVGVSKYSRRPVRRMSDLEYADDDVVHWLGYLKKAGYQCKVFGDEFSIVSIYCYVVMDPPYPQWDDPVVSLMIHQRKASEIVPEPFAMSVQLFKTWSNREENVRTDWCSSPHPTDPETGVVTPICVCCPSRRLLSRDRLRVTHRRVARPVNDRVPTWITSWQRTSAPRDQTPVLTLYSWMHVIRYHTPPTCGVLDIGLLLRGVDRGTVDNTAKRCGYDHMHTEGIWL